MDKTRRLKNNGSYWDHFSRLLLVYTVVVCSAARCGCTAATDNATAVCPEYTACMKCTQTQSCSWSLDRQTCVDSAQKADSLMMVYSDENCPRYAVDKPLVYTSDWTVDYAFTVRVANDVNGFLAFLNRTNVTCFGENSVTSAALVTTNSIACGPITHEHSRMEIRFYYVAFGGDRVLLRFDNRTDNYVTFYWDTAGCKDVAEYCATCIWDDADGRLNRYDRCSSDNPCTSDVFEYRSVHGAHDYGAVVESDAAVWVRDCRAMEIESVAPTSAPWNGGTTMRIAVRNHGMLAEQGAVTVTVAGRNCLYPKTKDNETITCVTSPTSAAEPSVDSRIVVTYGSVRLATAVGSFRFVYPKVTSVSPVCGSLRGGTQLRIEGESLDASRTVRVSVGAQNATCEMIARGPRYIFCVTAAVSVPVPATANQPATGPVSVRFDKALSRTVADGFTYTDDEPTLDAGQRFKGIASGGTTVPVRGRRFTCVQSAELHVVVHTSSRHISAGCVVHNDTYMVCRSPKLTEVLSASETSTVLANMFFRLDFAGRVLDLSPQPDSPGYMLYADPEFIDFEGRHKRVAIGGRGLDLGYEIADLTIRFQNASGACNVTKRTQHQIVCDPSTLVPLPADDSGVQAPTGDDIVVTIGDSFEYIVKKKSTRYNVYPVKIFSIFSGIKIFLVITAVLGSILFCIKTSLGDGDSTADIINVQYRLSDDIRKATGP